MKLKPRKIGAFFLALMLVVPMFWQMSTSVVSAAATPTFKKSKVEITDVGDTYQLVIDNKVTGSKYKYTSSQKKVATVSSKGIVTSVGAGTTTITCKITYPTKKTKTITCKVTVIIPAEEIVINNATETNGAHIIKLGGTYDFEYSLTPKNSTDKTYWYVDKGDTESISVIDSAEGIITAKKAGKATLRVKAYKTSSKDAIKKTHVDDSIIIEVVEPKAEIKSAEITSSTEITVIFDSPVDKSTVINSSGKLTSNITISLAHDIKGVVAKDPGALTPTLSSDLSTLTISSVNMFDGIYVISFSNSIKTSGGIAMEEYYKQMTYDDNTGPSLVSNLLDETGFINTLKFSEAIDINSLKVSNPQVASGSTADTSTIGIIGYKNNYVLSTDKKSLTINLAGINAADYQKQFSVVLSGIKDLAGNIAPAAYYTAYLRTDTTPKAQAVPINLVRTSYNVITATFSRGLREPGSISVNNGSSIRGVIDPDNNRKVNYTISEAEAIQTGYINITIGYWDSYNVIQSDNSAYTPKTFQVNFTSDTTSPYLSNYVFDVDTSILTLTFTEPVTLASTTGIFTASLSTVTDDIQPGASINYTSMPATESENVIKVKLSNLTVLGTYSFNLEPGFVSDKYRNRNLVRAISISNTGGTSRELPGPYSITQSATNLNLITVEFLNKIDVASAQAVGNYKITGVTVTSAQVTKNTSETGSTVILTVADSSIDVTVERPVVISGILGYNGSYSAITNYTTMIELKENKKPRHISTTFDRTTHNIMLNFDEQIQGTISLKVTILNSGAEIPCTVAINGTSVVISQGGVPSGTILRIQIIENNITDASGNACMPMSNVLAINASY